MHEIWTEDLEGLRAFREGHPGATAGARYPNPRRFTPASSPSWAAPGLAHPAFTIGSEAGVELTAEGPPAPGADGSGG